MKHKKLITYNLRLITILLITVMLCQNIAWSGSQEQITDNKTVIETLAPISGFQKDIANSSTPEAALAPELKTDDENGVQKARAKTGVLDGLGILGFTNIYDRDIILKLKQYLDSRDDTIRYLAAGTIIEEVLGFEEFTVDLRIQALKVLKPFLKINHDSEICGQVDTHTHTCISDGYQTPTALVVEAFEEGLDTIAITDHNMFTSGESFKAAKILGIKLIFGAELACRYEGKEVHVLVLGNKEKLPSLSEEGERIMKKVELLRNESVKRAEEMRNRLKSEFFVSEEEVLEVSRNNSISHIALANAIFVKYPTKAQELLPGCKTGREFFNKYLKYYADLGEQQETENMLTIEEVIRLSYEIGCKAVLAHPNELGKSNEESIACMKKIVREARSVIIDGKDLSNVFTGIEAYSHKARISGITEDIIDAIEEMNRTEYRSNPLIVFAGSDYHGAYSMPEHPLGNAVDYPWESDLKREFKDALDIGYIDAETAKGVSTVLLSEEEGTDTESGYIAKDDELIAEFDSKLGNGEVEIKELEDNINLTALYRRIIESGCLEDEERNAIERYIDNIDQYKVALFEDKKWLKNKESFVLARHDRAARRILIGERLYNMLRNDISQRDETLAHELICAPLQAFYKSRRRGHLRAIEIQQKLFKENYEFKPFICIKEEDVIYIADHKEGGRIALDEDGFRRPYKGKLGELLEWFIDDLYRYKLTITSGLLDEIKERTLQSLCKAGKVDFMCDDPAVERALFLEKEMDEQLSLDNDEEYQVLKSNSHYAEEIVTFARAILDDDGFKGKKLLVLGRAGDLIYDALYGLAKMMPEYRDRIDDIVMMDFSIDDPGFSHAYKENPWLLAEYVASHGIDAETGVVIIDELGIGSEERNYVLTLKKLLIEYGGFSERNVKTALMNSIPDNRNLAMLMRAHAHGIDVDRAYFIMDKITLENVDLVFGYEIYKEHTMRYNNICACVNWMANEYDSGRKYKTVCNGREIRQNYIYIQPDGTYGEDNSYYDLRRFYYKCGIYNEIVKKHLYGEEYIESLLDKIKRLSVSGHRSFTANVRSPELIKIFRDEIMHLWNKELLLDRLMDLVIEEDANALYLVNFVEVISMYFSENYIQKNGLSISMERYMKLWNIYELTARRTDLVLGCIKRVLKDSSILEESDLGGRFLDIARTQFAGECLKLFNDVDISEINKYSQNEYEWFSAVMHPDYDMRDVTKEIMQNPDGEKTVYDGIIKLILGLESLTVDKKTVRKSLADMVVSELEMDLPENLNEPKDVCAGIFEEPKNAHQFYRLVSLLRLIYPDDISLEDPENRPPLKYAQEEGIVFEIAKGLFITPVTESFRRHMIFSKDEFGDIKFAFEVLVPGDIRGRRNIKGLERMSVLIDLSESRSRKGYCPNLVYFKRIPDGIYEMYGKQYIFNDHCRLHALAMDYRNDGKRLGHYNRAKLITLARELDISYKELLYIIVRQVADILAFVHSKGHIGHNEKGGRSIHTGNLRLIRYGKSISIELAGDFESFAPKSSFENHELEMKDDLEDLLRMRGSYVSPPLLDLIDIPENEIRLIIDEARKRYRLKPFCEEKSDEGDDGSVSIEFEKQKDMEIAVVGLGGWGMDVIVKTFLRDFPDVFVHGIARSNYDKRVEETMGQDNIVIYREDEYESKILKNPYIKAVVIATQMNNHYELAKKALLAGKDVFVEKPFTATYEQARELVSLASEKNRVLIIGFEIVFENSLECIKRMLKERDFGEIESITVNWWNYQKNKDDVKIRQENVIEDLGPHVFSIIHYLLGREDISDLEAFADSESATVEFNYNGIKIFVDLKRDCEKDDVRRDVVIKGKKLEVGLNMLNREIKLTDVRKTAENHEMIVVSKGEPTVKIELQNFLRAIESRIVMENHAKPTLWISEVIEKAVNLAKKASEGQTQRDLNDELLKSL